MNTLVSRDSDSLARSATGKPERRRASTPVGRLAGVAALSLILILGADGNQAARAQLPASVVDALTPAGQNDADEPTAAPTEVTVTERGTIRLHAADLPLSTVLHLLSLNTQRNIVTSPNVNGRVTANLYDVSFEEALTAILTANGAGYIVADNFIYVYTRSELSAIEAARTGRRTTQVYRLNYTSPADAKTYIEPVLEKEDQIAIAPLPETGLKSDRERGGGESNAQQAFIMVTARAPTHERIRSLLREIDSRPQQVLIEATILRAELTDDNSLGIDFTLVGGVDLQLLGATSTGVQDVRLGNLPTARFERFNASASTEFSGDVPDGGLTLGIIKDHVGVFLKAIEQVTNTTVLANPKVLALNRQKGQVIVGRRDGFLTTTVTETQAIQTVEFLETGTQLIFRPFVGDDGFIRVELHPEDSVGFVNAQGLPSEQTTEVTTNVIVRDGETILIGGLFREVTTDARSQIPFLGSIPGFGALFRSNNDSTGREEVIILLTIHVVKDHEAYAEASREQLENVDRLRVGVRQGLMWHGRERMAQTHYRKALNALAEGDREKALWQADLSLNNLPQFLPATQLKERILGQRAWDEDATTGREFLHRLIARERGYDIVPFARPEIPEIPPPRPDDTEANPGALESDPESRPADDPKNAPSKGEAP